MSFDLPKLQDINLTGKTVLVRAELNAPMENGEIKDATRLQAVCSTLALCIEKGARKIVVLGKLGRPKGGYEESLSQKPLVAYFNNCLGEELGFVEYKPFEQFGEVVDAIKNDGHRVVLLENVRFWDEEGSNNEEFARQLSTCGDIYVNDAFGVSHRSEATIVGIPKFLPRCVGVQFAMEVENLSLVLDNPKRPVVTILSGAKEDKLEYLDDFIRISDRVLVGGLLPTFLGEDYKNDKVALGRLIQDKEDITKNTAESFALEIAKAGTIVVSGPLGKFEDPGHRQGTKEVFEAVANSSAFKVAGGGDTGRAIAMLGLTEKFDFVSTGGGAMLEFLAKGTLPGITALLN